MPPGIIIIVIIEAWRHGIDVKASDASITYYIGRKLLWEAHGCDIVL